MGSPSEAEPSVRSGRWPRPVRLAVRSVAALLSLSVLLVSGLAWAGLNSLSTSLTVVPFHPGKQATGSRTAGTDQNILLVGDDSRQGATRSELAAIGADFSPGDNTDTIMLLHLPADGRSASLMSFPRDSLVKLPGGQQTGKINSVYAAGGGDAGGGPAALADTITGLTGLAVDHFMKISLLGFYRLSIAVGGVDLNLCQAQNAGTEGDASHPNGYSGIDLKQGWNRNVQGKQALAFVRQRHGPGLSDYTRIQRQRYFIGALFSKLGTPQNLANPLRLERVISAVGTSLTVDTGLRGSKLLSVAAQLRSLTAGKLDLATIPMLGPLGAGDSYQGEQVDLDAMPAFIARFAGQPDSYRQARPAVPGAVTVTVVNGGRPAGSAGQAAAALRSRGFHASASQASASSAITQIRYPAGFQAQAKALAAAVPGAVAVLSHAATGLQLLLGTDRVHVLGVPAPAGPAPAGPTQPAVRTAADASCVP